MSASSRTLAPGSLNMDMGGYGVPAPVRNCALGREIIRLLLALRAPEGRAAVLVEAAHDTAAARCLALFAFAVVDPKRMLEIAELARSLAMVAQRRAAGLDRLIQHRV